MKIIPPLLLLLAIGGCSQPPKAHFADPPAAVQVTSPADPGSLEVAPRAATTPTELVLEIAGQTNQAEAFTPVEPATGAAPTTPGTGQPGVAATEPGVGAGIPGGAGTVPPVAGAIPSGAAPGEQIIEAHMFDFRNAPLEQILDVYAKLVNRTLLRPSTLPVQQQITLKTQTDLTQSEAIQALDAVLGMNGLAMINVSNKFVKVLTAAEAPGGGAPTDSRPAGELPDMGQYLTHIAQLKYVKPAELQPVLLPFAKLPNSILPIDSSQIIVLRDYTENVKRMLEMIERVDIAVPAEFLSEVIPIKYAKASEMADALNSLSGGGGSTSIGRPQQTARPGALGTGMRGGTPGYQQGMTQPGMNQPGAAGAQGAAGAGSPFMSRLQGLVQRASASGDLEILGQTKMIADERSNSLLIFATRQDMEMIKNIVSKLDVVLAQVLIETVIMDVNMNDTLSYGVSAGQHPKTGSSGTIGGVYNNSGALGTLSGFFQQNLTNGNFPTSSGLSYFGRYKGDLDVVLQAAASDSRVNVVQKPRILTSHATPGSIFVGSTVPYVTSTYYGGGYGGPSSSYQQLQVGIGLMVTPYINPDGLVVMQIDETIDEVSGSIEITGVGAVPTTTSRKLSAEVAVRDGDTIILGGFIRNSSNKQNAGVPLLKDIPLLGALFSSRSDTKARTELLVMMRPTVLKTPEIAALATQQEKELLPGVVHAEAEVLELERKELERSRKLHGTTLPEERSNR